MGTKQVKEAQDKLMLCSFPTCQQPAELCCGDPFPGSPLCARLLVLLGAARWGSEGTPLAPLAHPESGARSLLFVWPSHTEETRWEKFWKLMLLSAKIPSSATSFFFKAKPSRGSAVPEQPSSQYCPAP